TFWTRVVYDRRYKLVVFRDRLGSFRPVASCCPTSRRTLADNRASFCWTNRCTASASRSTNDLSAHDIALTIIALRSSIRSLQILSLRSASPRPPRAWTFNGTVLTNAARRHHRSSDCAHCITVSSSI